MLFTVDFRNERWTGYRALVAALSKAVEGGVPVYEPSYYGHVTLDELEEIFKSETHVPIPLLEQRLNCLHEVAAILETVSHRGICLSKAIPYSALIGTP